MLIINLIVKKKGRIKEIDVINIGNIISNKEAVIEADLNAKHPIWGRNVTNVSGKVLVDWLSFNF